MDLDPGNPESMRTLALAHKKLAALYGVAGRYDDARRDYEQAASLDEKRLARNPRSSRAKLDLSYDYSDLGWVAGRLGKHQDSLESYRKVLALRTEVSDADPKDQRAAEALASAVAKMGITLRSLGDLAGSERELRRAIAMQQGWIQRPDAHWSAVRALALVHDDLADTLEDQCKAARAPVCVQAAAELALELGMLEDLRRKGLLPKADDKLIAATKDREAKLRRGER
jgi:tetratricopeptide (TPR) repeat protein